MFESPGRLAEFSGPPGSPAHLGPAHLGAPLRGPVAGLSCVLTGPWGRNGDRSMRRRAGRRIGLSSLPSATLR